MNRRRPQFLCSGACAVLELVLLFAARIDAQDVSAPAFELTNIQQVVEFGLERARLEHPRVRLEGVVTFTTRRNDEMFIHDTSAGVVVRHTNLIESRFAGQRVRVSGELQAGLLAPFISRSRVEILGTAPMPAPLRVPLERLHAGEFKARWVEIPGVIRDVVKEEDFFILSVRSTGSRIPAFVMGPRNTPLPLEWLDASIVMQGVSWPEVDREGKHIGTWIHVAKTNFLQITPPDVTNIFHQLPLPLGTSRELRRQSDFRRKVTGVVIYHSPSGRVYLRDETGAGQADLLVPLARSTAWAKLVPRPPVQRLEPGARIELIGAPTDALLAPHLVDAEFKLVGNGTPPLASVISTKDALSGRYDGQLVTLRAKVVGRDSRSAGQLRQEILSLEDAGSFFEALLETSETNALPTVPKNTLAEVSGICTALPVTVGPARNFRLVLRSPRELQLLGHAPWWTSLQPGRILAISSGFGVLALAWIWTLRRRVAHRTAELLASNEKLRNEIAERQGAEAHLARFKAVAEATSDMVAMATIDHSMLFMNQAGRHMVGLGLEEDITRFKVSDFYSPEVNKRFAEEGFSAALRDGTWSAELAVLHRDGHEIPVSMVGLILRSDAGQPEYLACIVRDISERKRAEAELMQGIAREKELNELKSRFVSMVSHEFRTPLGIIMASAEILDAYVDRLPPEERQSNLRDIFEATRQMSHMMEEALLLGRVETGHMTFKPASLDLMVFCQRLVDEITSATNNRCPIRLSTPKELLEASADESLLRHIFTNLLSNAVKYSPAGSTVEFTLETRAQLAVFVVRDRGIGIPEEDARLIFQAFHRGRNVGDTPGTGLGMAIVKHCVELHGGKVAVESREGIGTAFIVALPLFGPAVSGNYDTTQFLRGVIREDTSILS